MTVLFGTVTILTLASLLVWLRLPRPDAVSASDGVTGRLGQSVVTVAGIDHLVERVVGPAGYTTLPDQLAALGVTLNSEDRYTAIPDPAFGVGSLVEITRALPISIVDATVSTDYRTWQSSVGELLDSLDIKLDADDRVEPGLLTRLGQQTVVTITRVGTSQESQTEEIPFKTVTKSDDTFLKGQTRTDSVGRVGLRRISYEVRRENGVEVSRQRTGTEVVREPTDRITVVGTKVVSYGSGTATWYGLKSGFGAAHNTLPMGTHVKVTNLSNGKTVDVVINDHGIQGSAVIDLTRDAFAQIAPLGAGRIPVKLEKDYD